MTAYRVVALPAAIACEVRASRAAPGYGHPAHAEVAKGYGPCRSCLRAFRVGAEERLLFTYDAFGGLEEYPSPGPVFIHREDCARWEGDGFPPELRDLPLMLEGYAAGRLPVAREGVSGGDVDGALARLLAHAGVDYVHVRNAEAGCFIARVERVPSPA
jgi:hypothetical protein